MAGQCQSAEIALQLIQRREQIGREHDQAAFARQFGDAAQRFVNVRCAAFRVPFEGDHQPAQMTLPMTRRQIVAHGFVESNQAHRVSLRMQEPGQRGGEGADVFGLGIGERAIIHGAALVHQEVTTEIGFVLESFQIVTVGAGVEPPIQVTGVFAGSVLAVSVNSTEKP